MRVDVLWRRTNGRLLGIRRAYVETDNVDYVATDDTAYDRDCALLRADGFPSASADREAYTAAKREAHSDADHEAYTAADREAHTDAISAAHADAHPGADHESSDPHTHGCPVYTGSNASADRGARPPDCSSCSDADAATDAAPDASADDRADTSAENCADTAADVSAYTAPLHRDGHHLFLGRDALGSPGSRACLRRGDRNSLWRRRGIGDHHHQPGRH